MPGALDYRRRDGGSVEELVRRFLESTPKLAAIIGHHGTGKSTLLASMRSLMERTRTVYAYRIASRQGSRKEYRVSKDKLLFECKEWLSGSVVLVDGYEQLSNIEAWRLRRWSSSSKCGLIVTGHRKLIGIPTLWQTGIDEEDAKRLRDDLLDDYPELLHHAGLESAWKTARQRFPTDLRETLFAMYDWVEATRFSAESPSLPSFATFELDSVRSELKCRR
jgi:energy-coupling factor transporter ATP-binding protein EcfA2